MFDVRHAQYSLPLALLFFKPFEHALRRFVHSFVRIQLQGYDAIAAAAGSAAGIDVMPAFFTTSR
jgi:hypothetical protein